MSSLVRPLSSRDLCFRSEWETHADGIPSARYTDPDFARLEAEKLWPRVWQMACREDEVDRPGDYTVYEILNDAIMVVRVDETTIKAYHNVCPHRATALAVGSGRFPGQIICPFHGWRWNLKGENILVLNQDEFCGGKLRREDVALQEVRVARWMGSVWINMNPGAPSFEQHIAPIRSVIDPLGLENMRFYWWKSVRVPANWKVTQEAFHESYHVPQTHPQGLYGGSFDRESAEAYTAGTEYFAHANGHAHFRISHASRLARTKSAGQDFSGMINFLAAQARGLDALCLEEEVQLARTMRHRTIPEGTNVYDAFLDVVHEHYKNQGRPFAERGALEECADAFIFPHVTLLPAFAGFLMYRLRPAPDNNPNFCEYDMYSLRTYAEGEAPPRPKLERIEDPMSPDAFRLIPRQDFSNIPRQQKGLRSRAMKRTRLSQRQEVFLPNMHSHLDRYLKE